MLDLPLLLAAPATVGCCLMLRAGALESRGQLSRARRRARLAGLTLFAGTLLQAGAGTLVRIRSLDDSAVWLSGTGLLIAAGVAGLLAGLSGKPRPSGYLAVLLYVAGVAAWVY